MKVASFSGLKCPKSHGRASGTGYRVSFWDDDLAPGSGPRDLMLLRFLLPLPAAAIAVAAVSGIVVVVVVTDVDDLAAVLVNRVVAFALVLAFGSAFAAAVVVVDDDDAAAVLLHLGVTFAIAVACVWIDRSDRHHQEFHLTTGKPQACRQK